MNRLLRSTVSLLNTENRSTYCRLLAYYSQNTGSKEHIDGLVKDKKVVLFMKGTPDQPMCGFSRLVVQCLNMHGVEFKAHNVLQDESLRQGIKDYSNWPTIPQVYLNGEFIGGSDVLVEMHKNGELVDELQKIGIRSALLDHKDSS
ncbi:glutaredoxin-related protein 5, mitochondrial-like [Mytilus trossulus]|uniref:glutaredoxin-related protein 5, mitochondrial-like n=1 Tax=Mytilus trossulus TaxID=6551 RepID=UPI0030040367